MLNFNINLTSLAVILWSGMLVIAGSIWVLSSQVRKLADLIEQAQAKSDGVEAAPQPQPLPALRIYAASGRARVVRRVAPAQVRRASRA